MGISNYRICKAEKDTSGKAGREGVTGEVKSPCINKCELDQNRICTGCERTLAEIMVWGDADDSLRQRILEELKKRKKSAEK